MVSFHVGLMSSWFLQGSILGPLLFIIFINDLVDICEDNIKLYLFADDAKICVSGWIST